jgi:hypothetical protein
VTSRSSSAVNAAAAVRERKVNTHRVSAAAAERRRAEGPEAGAYVSPMAKNLPDRVPR